MTDQFSNNQTTLTDNASDLIPTVDALTIEDLTDPLNLAQQKLFDSSSPRVMKIQPTETRSNNSQALPVLLDSPDADVSSNPVKPASLHSTQGALLTATTPESDIASNQHLIAPISHPTITASTVSETTNLTYEPTLPELQGLVAGKDYGAHQVIVKFKQGIQTAQTATLQSTLGATTLKATALTGAQLWDVGTRSTAEAILALKNNPLVEYVEPNYQLSLTDTATSTNPTATPNDPGYDQLWGLHNTGQTGGRKDADIDAPEAWDIARGKGVVVGVIDSGIDYTHPDLRNNLWTNPGEIANDGIDNDGNGYIDDYYGYDFANNDSNPFDDHSHGTHVAGTIAAQANNNRGIAGVAPETKVMALKFLKASGSGSTFDAIEAINYAVMMGADITNNSWGGGGYSQALYDAIANADSAGQLFVAAAGNGGFDGIGDNNDFLPSYPASYDLDNIISVAASDHRDRLGSFSNYGAKSVDLAAPGVSILSTVPGGYAEFNGTSMAAPHVAGAASLLLSKNPNLTSTQLKERLLSTVDPVTALKGKTVSGGRLNAHQALLGGGSQTDNYSFETGNFTDWKTYGDAEVITSNIGISPTDGKYQAQVTNGDESFSVAQLESLLKLNKGLFSSVRSGNLREGSAIQLKPLTVKAGDIMTIDWNFLTNEKTPDLDNNDFAFVTFNGNGVFDLGDTSTPAKSFDPLVFNTQTGYQTARFRFVADGTYTMAIGVMDEGDTGVDSGVLVDNVQLISANGQTQTVQLLAETNDPLLAGGLDDLTTDTTASALDLAAEHAAINPIQPYGFPTVETDWSLGQTSEYGLGQSSILDNVEPTAIAVEKPLAVVG